MVEQPLVARWDNTITHREDGTVWLVCASEAGSPIALAADTRLAEALYDVFLDTRDVHETRDLRDRITAALVARVLADADGRPLEAGTVTLVKKSAAAQADTVMSVVNAALADRDARIRELEGKVRGALDRRCVIPGCPASYRADTGPDPGAQWMRSTSPSVLLCPDHAHLMTGATPHVPRLDHDTRTCACTCGHPLPGPTLGQMSTAWIAHALALLDADEQQNQEPVEAGLRDRIATALEPVATPRHRSAEVAQWIADDIMHVAEAEIAQGLRRAAELEQETLALRNRVVDLQRRIAQAGPHPRGTVLTIPDTPKMLRETLCFAQSAIELHPDQSRTAAHVARLGRLISECDRHRPLGANGKHGNLHTPTCGCEDTPASAPEPTRTLIVQRACNGCGTDLRPATHEELEGCIVGIPLPDVTGECPTCTPPPGAGNDEGPASSALPTEETDRG